MRNKLKKCTRCGKTKPVDDFYYYSYKNVRRSICKQCEIDYQQTRKNKKCDACVHYSALRKVCKLGKKTRKCEEYDEYLGYVEYESDYE